MQSLTLILKLHPPPWSVAVESDGLIRIRDANGVPVDLDSDHDGNFRAYVEAVNVAALAREWRDVSRQIEAATDTCSPSVVWELKGVRARARAALLHALDTLDNEVTHG